MPSSSEHTSGTAARAQTRDVPTVADTLARLGTALAFAAGALLEHPDGSSPLAPLTLFAVAVVIAILAHDAGARRHAAT